MIGNHGLSVQSLLKEDWEEGGRFSVRFQRTLVLLDRDFQSRAGWQRSEGTFQDFYLVNQHRKSEIKKYKPQIE